MTAEKSSEKKRQQPGWWVLASLLFILSLVGIRYISSQGWWENRFGLSKPTFQTINTGLSVQAPNQSGVPISTENLNSGRPTPLPPSTDTSSKDSERQRRALW